MKKELLLIIARASIETEFDKRKIAKEKLLKEYPELGEEGAVFVTLTIDNNLRGCIGSLTAHRSLLDDVIHNAKASAFEDSRFLKLSEDELKKVKIEISILSKPKELIYRDREDLKSKIRPNIDGVILKSGLHRATFLPQVWEQIPKFELFFGHLCQKAGLRASGCLDNHPTILTYQVEKIEERGILNSRKMSVAGSFYPRSCQEIEESFEEFNKKVDNNIRAKFEPKAIISPHAGYVYSGFTANSAYRLIDKSQFKRVVVLGPSHQQYFKGASVALYDRYRTPCGDLDIDLEYSKNLIEKYEFLSFEEKLHKEHSTETQMPFIKHYFPNAKVVEIIYSDIEYKSLSKVVKETLDEPETLLVVSTDLSHFHTQKEANRVDNLCIEGVKKLDENLKGCEACGLIGVKALLFVAKKSQIVDYRTSYDYSGDNKRVVGYLSVLLM